MVSVELLEYTSVNAPQGSHGIMAPLNTPLLLTLTIYQYVQLVQQRFAFEAPTKHLIGNYMMITMQEMVVSLIGLLP